MTTRPEFGTLSFYEAVALELNNDPVWLEMAKAITYSMVFVYEAPIGRQFFLRFEQGRISETAELATPTDKPADFVMTGKPPAWKGLITQELNPNAALVMGKIKVKGKQTTLLRHMKSFSYLINKMSEIDAVFAEG